MTTLELKLNLPDQLARDAKAAGLLTEQELERLVREALRARSLERLDAARVEVEEVHLLDLEHADGPA